MPGPVPPQVTRQTSTARQARTPARGELVHDTTSGVLYVGDGSTVGGINDAVQDRAGQLYNVRAYGAKGDGVTLNDAALTAGSAVLTSVAGRFKSTDAGRPIGVVGAGTTAGHHVATISSYQSAGQVTLSANATTTVAGAVVYYGTKITDAAVAAGSAVLTSASAPFVSGDAGKPIAVIGAGPSGGILYTTILSYQSAGQVTLAANASFPTTGATAVYGSQIATGAITSGQAILTSTSNPFVSGDAGKAVLVVGAGTTAGHLYTTILSYQSPTQVTLAASAGTGVAGTVAVYGTNDAPALQAAIDACSAAGGGTVYVPPGTYIVGTPNATTPTVYIVDNITLRGAGSSSILKRASGGIASPILLNRGWSGGTATGNTRITVRDLALDGNKLITPTFLSNEQGLWLSLVTDSAVSNVWSYNNRTNGFALEYCKGVSLTHCVASGNLKNGYYCSGSDKITLSGCIGHDNGSSVGGSYAFGAAWYCTLAGCSGWNDVTPSLGVGRDTQYLTVAGGYYEGMDTSSEAIGQPAAVITGATNASPIQITTSAAHGYVNGDKVQITGVVGNTAANTTTTISNVTSTTFTLDGTTGNGAYVSGGTAVCYRTNALPYAADHPGAPPVYDGATTNGISNSIVSGAAFRTFPVAAVVGVHGATSNHGIRLLNGTSNLIVGCRVGPTGNHGINIANMSNTTVRGCRVSNAGTGSANAAGITIISDVSGAAANNTVENCDVWDDQATPTTTFGLNFSQGAGGSTTGSRAIGNRIGTGVTTPLFVTAGIALERNRNVLTGTVLPSETVATAAPTTGTWALGDFVWNSAPTSNGTLGWSCTTAGTPGTWTACPVSGGSITVPTASVLKGSGGALAAAVAGTDYLAPTGSGASLTGLNATNVSTGTLADARLTTNVPLKAGINTFTAANTFNGGINLGFSMATGNIAAAVSGIYLPRTADLNGWFTDYQDEFAYAGLRGTVTYSTTPSGIQGQAPFQDSSNSVFWNNGTAITSPLQIVVDLSVKPITAAGNGNYAVGLTFRSGFSQISNIAIEFWDPTAAGGAGDWQATPAYNQAVTITGGYWVSPTMSPSGTSSVVKLRLSLTLPATLTAQFSIERFLLYHQTAAWNPWHLSTGGGTVFGHIFTAGTAPTIAAGTGAGTGPTVTLTGTDTDGKVTVTTGTTPTASATVATITYAATYGTAPKGIVLTPANVNAAALTGTGAVYEDSTVRAATTFTLKVGSTALTATTTYIFSYHVGG